MNTNAHKVQMLSPSGAFTLITTQLISIFLPFFEANTFKEISYLKFPPNPLLCCRVWANISYFLMSLSLTERRANLMASSKWSFLISGTGSSSSTSCCNKGKNNQNQSYQSNGDDWLHFQWHGKKIFTRYWKWLVTNILPCPGQGFLHVASLCWSLFQ